MYIAHSMDKYWNIWLKNKNRYLKCDKKNINFLYVINIANNASILGNKYLLRALLRFAIRSTNILREKERKKKSCITTTRINYEYIPWSKRARLKKTSWNNFNSPVTKITTHYPTFKKIPPCYLHLSFPSVNVRNKRESDYRESGRRSPFEKQNAKRTLSLIASIIPRIQHRTIHQSLRNVPVLNRAIVRICLIICETLLLLLLLLPSFSLPRSITSPSKEKKNKKVAD